MGLSHALKNGLVLEHLPSEVFAVLVDDLTLADSVVRAASLMTSGRSFLHWDGSIAIRFEQISDLL